MGLIQLRPPPLPPSSWLLHFGKYKIVVQMGSGCEEVNGREMTLLLYLLYSLAREPTHVVLPLDREIH